VSAGAAGVDLAALKALHRRLDGCTACPKVVGPVVHGPALDTDVFVLGQAPGPREGAIGRPFAWTAGKTLFSWLEAHCGAGEARVRERLYFAAVARCFPGKAKGGGDRPPSKDEAARCRTWLEQEVELIRPALVIPIGALAIAQVLGGPRPLAEVVGTSHRVKWLGHRCDVVPLPHPSGASTWHRMEPGKTLLEKALALLAAHPAWKRSVVGDKRD